MSDIKLHSEQQISRIAEGTVIDHITASQATPIWYLLKLHQHDKRIYMGLNLHSTTMKKKDLIKIEERALQPEEANQIAIFAPDATISIIQNFVVKEKYKVTPPKQLIGCIRCPNSKCISNFEGSKGSFAVSTFANSIQLSCIYCRKIYSPDDLTVL